MHDIERYRESEKEKNAGRQEYSSIDINDEPVDKENTPAAH